MADPVPDGVVRAGRDAQSLSPETKARNAALFDQAAVWADRLIRHAEIIRARAELELAHDLKVDTRTAAWMFRELIAAVNAIEEAP